GLTERTAGPDAALAFVQRALQAQPEGLDLHRLYQALGTAAGKRPELLAAYRKRLYEQPDSADRVYLFARLQPPSQAAPMLEDLVRRFPDHVASRRAHAWTEFQLGHFAQALDSWKVLRKLAPKEWPEHLPMVARALVAARRGDEALDEIGAAFDE